MSNISFSSGYGEYTSGEFFKSAAFEITSNGFYIFSREFRSNSPNFVNLNEDHFNLTQHSFVTGEELIYDYPQNGISIPIGIVTTTISGVSTDILPRTLYAVKQDFSTLKVSATKADALLPNPVTLSLRSYGTGIHKISSKNPNLNSLITINNIIQDPIISTSTTTSTAQSIVESDLSVTVEDPDELTGGDLIQINNEIMRVLSVGIGTTNNVFIERFILGTNAGIHSQNSLVTKVRGNYNIVENFIHFSVSPYGNSFDPESGLTNSSTFSGRVFLRSGKEGTTIGPYDKNFIFDYISESFTGKNSTFTLKNKTNNVVGISTDNAIVTINDVFQVPSRLSGNVINGAYTLTENVGISSIVFTGISTFPDYDVNISEYPRGGIILSVGATEGFGYQPLISAGGTAIVSTAGTIQSISIGYSGSGYRSGIQTVNVGVGYSDVIGFDLEQIGTASISNGIIVGVSITNPGSGYTNTNPPNVYFDAPLSYDNLPLIYSGGSSGVGTGAKISVVVGQGSSVINFELTNLGFGYEEGEVLTVPIGGTTGIPTTSDFRQFQIQVGSVFDDDSSVRTIGQLVILDPIDSLFDGKRKSFPLKLNGEQTAILSRVGSDLNVENNLLIFIDTVLQVPAEAYSFRGGSIITFKEAPVAGSKSTILFYSGTEGVDTKLTNVLKTVKIGDYLQIFDNTDRIDDQNPRSVSDILSVDIVKTNLYDKQGISDQDEIRPVKWCPQNVDRFITGSGSTTSTIVSKDREIYESVIRPSTFVISGIGSTSSEIFVDNVKTFFDNVNESLVVNNISIISQIPQSQANLIANVSLAGTIQSVQIESVGQGYLVPPKIGISNPVGLGTTAVLTCALNSSGGISTVTIVNAGIGYTGPQPLVIVEEPRQIIETASDVSYEGDFGIIVGVGTTTVGAYFDLFIEEDSYLRDPSINSVGAAITGPSGISTNYYFYVSNSNVGNGLTSLNILDQPIGIGTTFIDNVYQVNSWNIIQRNIVGVGTTFVKRVNVKVGDNSSLVGLSATAYYGDYSWGRIYNVIKTGISTFQAYSPGITTSTIIQRSVPLKFVNYLN
jgi:hypothetical protein